ncbi:MAG: ATP-binding protein [Bacteroidales bacterium]|nr:ATP-binding protein [Bacteroidales bacterium]
MIIDDNDKMKERLNIIKEYFQENGVGSIIISGTKRYEEIKDIIGLIPRQFHIPPPNIEERSELWKTYLKCTGNKDGNELLDELASKYLFTPGQIKSVIQKSFINSINKIDENMMVELNDLYKYCKEESNQRLFTYSQKIDPKYTWDDIIIPIDNLNQLKEICNCVKNRKRVYHDWGFESKISLGRGLNVLFSGPPGTGKTMSAEIIANELSLELYKIDLSRIVSKYIGETEKNLNKIFLEAETGNCILFFDEADALFGKRSEVKDSHDRYANIEISFLLQKIEEYEGIVMLATNMMKNFDSAFLRRLNYIVEFPFPNEKYRELIWNKVSGVFT